MGPGDGVRPSRERSRASIGSEIAQQCDEGVLHEVVEIRVVGTHAATQVPNVGEMTSNEPVSCRPITGRSSHGEFVVGEVLVHDPT